MTILYRVNLTKSIIISLLLNSLYILLCSQLINKGSTIIITIFLKECSLVLSFFLCCIVLEFVNVDSSHEKIRLNCQWLPGLPSLIVL